MVVSLKTDSVKLFASDLYSWNDPSILLYIFIDWSLVYISIILKIHTLTKRIAYSHKNPINTIPGIIKSTETLDCVVLKIQNLNDDVITD